MRTLHSYLTRQMLATLGMTVFVFTLLLLLGNVIKEVLTLVVRREASLGLAIHAIALLIPWVLAFSLPIGMLTAALLVFGRFSADQELTAARASGVSLVSLVTPVLLLSLAVSTLCLWLNFDVAPASRMAYKELLWRATTSGQAQILHSGQSVPFGDHTIFVGKVHSDGTNLDNVIVFQYDKTGLLTELIKGETGTLTYDMPHQQVILALQNEYRMVRGNDGWNPGGNSAGATFPIKAPKQAVQSFQQPIDDMTFWQLLQEKARIERRMSEPPAKGLTKAQLKSVQKDLHQMAAEQTTPVLVYLNRDVSFSLACVGFTLVGIPLGIRSHRRETSAGVATALILMLIYYSFVVLAQAWSSHAERAPYLIVWLPNFIFQAVGAVLLWRADRGL